MPSLLKILTGVHTALSLMGIFSGFVVMRGLLQSRGRQLWTFGFLCSTAATVLTGFFFPFHGVTPAILLGVISLVPLTLAFLSRYKYRLAGRWRGIYVVSALGAFYFNFFVLVVQPFEKIPALHALAPNQSEPPFAEIQILLGVFFIWATLRSLKKFRPETN